MYDGDIVNCQKLENILLKKNVRVDDRARIYWRPASCYETDLYTVVDETDQCLWTNSAETHDDERKKIDVSGPKRQSCNASAYECKAGYHGC